MTRPPWWWDQQERHISGVLADYRREIELKRCLGGFDDDALRWAEGELDRCHEELEAGELALLMVRFAGVVKHMAWARHPVRDKEAQRDKARRPRSSAKQRAMQVYRAADSPPPTCKAFMALLDQAGIDYQIATAERWFTEARKRHFPQ